MITVSVESIKSNMKFRQKINQQDLSDITFTENGKVVKISKEQIEEWEFCGLNNIDFISTGYYKENKS